MAWLSPTSRATVAGVLLLVVGVSPALAAPRGDEAVGRLFARENLIAWCIVPFDAKKRGPEERAAMLQKLGFRHFAYDWRGEHIPTFDAEVEALKRHGVALDAWWVAPGELNRESKLILDVLNRHQVKACLWVLLDLGADKATGDEQARRVEAAAAKLKPLADEAKAIGCTIALYNHGGWFGEPENQLAIVERLKTGGVENVGIVYNLHHGHDHLDRLPEILAKLKPHLVTVNLNGMVPGGDKVGKKIVPLGQGPRDLEVLRTLVDSGYRGPIGILGHTQDNAEERLRDNLDGLDWLVPQLEGKPPGPRPRPRTAFAIDAPPDGVLRLVEESRALGDPRRGADVFASTKFGCLTCHKVGDLGGAVGPELTTVGKCLTPDQIAESILLPAKTVKEGYAATVVATSDGKIVQGYKQSESDLELVLREAASGEAVRIAKATIEDRREAGTLMPDGLADAMTPGERRDLVRFLADLGRHDHSAAEMLLRQAHDHTPTAFAYDRKPLRPELWPNWQAPVNRDRVYDFYAKEANHFRSLTPPPPLLPPFPGLDGGKYGHWGNQNDDVWVDGRWNETDHGSVLCGVFRGAGMTVPKAVCVRLGDRGEMAACFNPETLCYEALWQGGFVKFSPRRHGLMDGLPMDGTALPRPQGRKPDEPFVYHGLYRHGPRVVFSYRVGDVEMLDAPWVEDGKFRRVVGPAKDHPLAHLTRGGNAQWPQVLETKGQKGEGTPYAVDTIAVPFANPWKAPMFFGGHAFLPDGTAFLCTVQGDVWRVQGLDDDLETVRWRRFASGLHQALGVVVADGEVYVLGRDQITRLRDLDGDGEADFHECVSNAYQTPAAGHDFVCGLERDPAGNFYTASNTQGLIRVRPDGHTVDVLATGFRNADGLGLSPEGVLTVPCSEGEWTPSSMICEIRPGRFYGYMGPKKGATPDLPLVYLPRGLDNSSGSQTYVPDDRWGPLRGQMLHFSYGAGTYFLVLRDRVDGQPQGAVVPMPGDFRSGTHRGRFNPKDGQLYVSGAGGWGTYTQDDGCFQRVRYTGDPIQLPVAIHAHENGLRVTFKSPIDRATTEKVNNHFAQCWNYLYSAAYGSSELSTRHPGTPGHDPLAIRSASVLEDGRSVFLEIPELQPVNQLHLLLRVDSGHPQELFATVHKLDAPFTGFPGYRPASPAKTIAAHPILADLARNKAPIPNPWKSPLPDARAITIEAGKNLTFSPSAFTVRAGETIKLTFLNPDVVPHNWALIRPGTLPKVGDLANRIISDPDAVSRHYIPKSDDVLLYADITEPGRQTSVFFRAPSEKGRYPFLCTFPGHWMIMNGIMIVE